MKFGINSLLWTSPFGTEDMWLMDKAADLGFDVFEIGFEQPGLIDYEKVAQKAEANGLDVVICGVFGPDRDISSEDPSARQSGVEYLRECVKACREVGGKTVSGPAYSAVGKARLVPDEQRAREWQRAVDNLRKCADFAHERGITLAIEPLNRYETDMVNTAEEALSLVEEVNSPGVGIHLDTFHMNIEEKSLPGAIGTAAPYLTHFHASENDRGTPGSGHVNWEDVRQALDEHDYSGPIIIESFDSSVEAIARAASIWRPLASSADDLARDGLRFLRSNF